MLHKRLRAFALAAVLLAGLCCLCGCKTGACAPLTVTFFKAGKADAAVLLTGGSAMVIDAGETDDGAELVRFLKNAGVSRLDALIVTHFDKDHVGGAAELLRSIPADRVLIPAYTSDSAEYLAFSAAMEDRKIRPEALTAACRFSFGDAEILTEPPADYSIAGTTDDADNELSLITTVTHGDVRLLFTGDAENGRLSEWLSETRLQRCDLIKMPHHGVYDSMQKTLVAAVSPTCAVICDSEKNPANENTLALLAEGGIRVFETKNGNITAKSNGDALTVRQD